MRFLFVVGAPRSGTTFLQTELFNKTLSITGQESSFFQIYTDGFFKQWELDRDPATSGRGILGLPSYISEEKRNQILKNCFYSVLESFREELLKDPDFAPIAEDASLFIEKTPSHALVIDRIHKILPNALFVHLYRDPFQVTDSLISASQTWGSQWAPSDPSEAYNLWKIHVGAARDALNNIPKNLWMEINYTELANHPKEITNEIIKKFQLETRSATTKSKIKIPIFNGVKIEAHEEPENFAPLTFRSSKISIGQRLRHRYIAKLLKKSMKEGFPLSPAAEILNKNK